jgi:hypothetical protein
MTVDGGQQFVEGCVRAYIGRYARCMSTRSVPGSRFGGPRFARSTGAPTSSS